MKITGEITGQDGKRYLLTDRCILIDPELVGKPMPEVLRRLINITNTPLEMIYRIQQGLGVYDNDGNPLPYDNPKPGGYNLFRNALEWLQCNYPDVGGWFYGIETIWNINKIGTGEAGK